MKQKIRNRAASICAIDCGGREIPYPWRAIRMFVFNVEVSHENPRTRCDGDARGAGLSACGPHSDVTIVPPKVPAGGRAVAIAVSQSDAKRLVVATESGGLFRTFDGGVSFQHLDAFPTLFAVDVVMASLDPNIVIATARDDFATTSGGVSGEPGRRRVMESSGRMAACGM